MNYPFIFLVTLSMFYQVDCAIVVGWMLKNPSVDNVNKTLGQLIPILMQNNEHHLASNDFQQHELESFVKLPKNHIPCISDKNCSDKNPEMYCDYHYGYCNELKKSNELCREDDQCHDSLICIFGRCEKPKFSGEQGARCIDSSDCNKGLCCARHLGEKVCKPILIKGQKCFIPFGGLDYSLNESCPCEEGLICRPFLSTNNSNRKRKNKNKFLVVDKLRCI